MSSIKKLEGAHMVFYLIKEPSPEAITATSQPRVSQPVHNLASIIPEHQPIEVEKGQSLNLFFPFVNGEDKATSGNLAAQVEAKQDTERRTFQITPLMYTNATATFADSGYHVFLGDDTGAALDLDIHGLTIHETGHFRIYLTVNSNMVLDGQVSKETLVKLVSRRIQVSESKDS